MEKFLLEFPEETRSVLKDMIDSDDGELLMHPRGSDLVVENRFDLCFTWKLTLKDVSGLPEVVEDGWLLWCSDIRADGDGYVLVGDVEGPELEDCMDVKLRFSGVDVELVSVRADVVDSHERPWWALSALANGIVRKSEVAPQLLNERERALLPLLREVAMLVGWRGAPGQLEFPLLRARMEPELLPLLERLEQSGPEWKRLWKASDKLQRRLNRSRYAHIWRGIYDEIAASQAEYPLKSCVSAQLRRRIEEKLRSMGYSGSYPDFIKRGEVRGLHVVESHGQTYFICNEKKAVFHIHCREYLGSEGGVMIDHVCGTELLREDEIQGDILSCMFDARGRRLIGSVSYVQDMDDSQLERKLVIAAKKAELRRLNKEERRSEGMIHGLMLFAVVYLLGCGLLAGVVISFFVVVSALVTALLFGWGEIRAMLREVPWMELFFFAWALFGGSFAISSIWDRKK